MATTTFVDGETIIQASWLNDVNEAVYNPAAAIIPASSIVNTPAGNIAATNVQAALNELDTEKQPLDAELTAIAGLVSAANTIPSFTGSGTAALLTTGTATGNIPLVGTKSATTTLAGLVELAIQAEAEAGTDNTVVMTPLTTAQAIAALSPSIGNGQVWTDVKTTPGRVIGGSYTNSTTKPIMVFITYVPTANDNYATITVGGVNIGFTTGNTGTWHSSSSFIVQPGATYTVTNTVGTISLTSWVELR